jgi:glucose-6-phosphate dehydrogenase assembly protein OpcA
MSNLVVFRGCSPTEHVDLTTVPLEVPLDEIVARHPSRVIVVHHTWPDSNRSSAVAAAVGITVFGSVGARYGVEQIALHSGCADEALVSVVLGLALGDLPLSIWWTDELANLPPIARLLASGRQFVYDSRGWKHVEQGFGAVASLAAKPNGPDIVDLNWRRLVPLRRALITAFKNLPASSRPTAVRVRYAQGEAPLAWLLAGWLSKVLDSAESRVAVAVQSGEPGANVLSVAFNEPTMTVTMDGHHVTLSGPDPPFLIPVRQEHAADALADELCNLAKDDMLAAAVVAAHAHLVDRAR